MPLPRLDEYVARHGERMEDLSGITAAQPYRPRGPQLSTLGVELLARKLVGGARLHRRTGEENAQLDRLTEAGLLHDRRRLTESGMTVARTLVRRKAHVRIGVAQGLAPLSVQAYLAGDHAVIVATESPAAWRGRERSGADVTAATTVWLDFCDVSYVPVALASWVGLSPAWSFRTRPEWLEDDLVRQRLDDPSTPPPDDADEHLRRMWAQPWFLWTLTGSGMEGLLMIDAGVAGQYSWSGREGTRVQLQRAPALFVWQLMAERIVPLIQASRASR